MSPLQGHFSDRLLDTTAHHYVHVLTTDSDASRIPSRFLGNVCDVEDVDFAFKPTASGVDRSKLVTTGASCHLRKAAIFVKLQLRVALRSS